MRFQDEKWHLVSLVKRTEGMEHTQKPRWTAEFESGETREDIYLGAGDDCVRFPPRLVGSRVEARTTGKHNGEWYSGEWCAGRVVLIDSSTGCEYNHTSEAVCILYNNQDWEEGRRFGDPDLRFVLPVPARYGQAVPQAVPQDVQRKPPAVVVHAEPVEDGAFDSALYQFVYARPVVAQESRLETFDPELEAALMEL